MRAERSLVVDEQPLRKPYYETVFTNRSDAEWDQAPGKDVIVAGLSAGLGAGELGVVEHVIDLGSGTGFLLNRIHTEVSGSWRLTGVDFSEAAVERGRGLYPAISFVCGNAAATDFPDGAFSVVVSYGSIEHFDRPEDGIAEAGRLLRPGGRFFIMVPSLEYYRDDRDDEGWYDDLTGQPQWNLKRSTWESYFRAAALELGPPTEPANFGALKPHNFFFGVKPDS
jgi:SAM-dependent methyltransferase